MRAPQAIELMVRQTTAFGSVGRATKDKLEPCDGAFICRGIQSEAWDAARLHWGGDHIGIKRLMIDGFKFAIRDNEATNRKITQDRLWRITGIALAEIGSPGRIWITTTNGMMLVKWTQGLRAMLYGVKESQWFNAYAKPYQSIYDHYSRFLDDAEAQVRRNERR